jgi:hypothetical protein
MVAEDAKAGWQGVRGQLAGREVYAYSDRLVKTEMTSPDIEHQMIAGHNVVVGVLGSVFVAKLSRGEMQRLDLPSRSILLAELRQKFETHGSPAVTAHVESDNAAVAGERAANLRLKAKVRLREPVDQHDFGA